MLHTLKVSTTDLKVGMFVSGLDRPWLETPFMMQGFRVDSLEEIAHLRSYCSFVFVDLTKSHSEVLEQLKLDPKIKVPEAVKKVAPARKRVLPKPNGGLPPAHDFKASTPIA